MAAQLAADFELAPALRRHASSSWSVGGSLPCEDEAVQDGNAQIAVIARRKANLGVTLIIDHKRSKLRRARRSRWACREERASQFARTAVALRAGRPRKGIT